MQDVMIESGFFYLQAGTVLENVDLKFCAFSSLPEDTADRTLQWYIDKLNILYIPSSKNYEMIKYDK